MTSESVSDKVEQTKRHTGNMVVLCCLCLQRSLDADSTMWLCREVTCDGAHEERGAIQSLAAGPDLVPLLEAGMSMKVGVVTRQSRVWRWRGQLPSGSACLLAQTCC